MGLLHVRVCDVCGVYDKVYRTAPRGTWAWLCKEHAPEPTPLPVCERCGKVTRPYSSDRRKYPNTVARGRTKPHLLCQACNVVFNETGTIERTELAIPDLTSAQITATLELLERHDALDLTEMLGLNKGDT